MPAPDEPTAGRTRTRAGATVAAPLLEALFGSPIPVRIEFFDKSAIGPADAATVLHVRSPNAIRRILFSPGEIGIARAFVAGDLDVTGDLAACMPRPR